MPIVQIIAAPDAVVPIQKAGSGLLDQLRENLLHHLRPAPETIQVMVQAALLPPIGCDLLCIVHHRASEMRTAEVRDACARALHDTLHGATGLSARVRLISIAPHDIAACDTRGDIG